MPLLLRPLQFLPRGRFPKATLFPAPAFTPRPSARLLFRGPEPSLLIVTGIMPPGVKTVVEYAKSSRSSCKKCFKTIDKNAVRIGSVSRDARGFDMTNWCHSECFRFRDGSSASPDAIHGFASLKASDQESLKRLLECSDIAKEERDDDVEIEQEERDAKKAKKDAVDVCFSSSAVKDKYKDALLSPKWKAFQTLIFLEQDDGCPGSSKIAAFDFDGSLANTSVKRVGPDAWSLLYPSIPEKLRKLKDDGYKLVIFTNESNIERWKNKRQVAVDSKIGRLNSFIKVVNVPMQVFIACGFDSGQAEDPFRKPKAGMWYLMERHFNNGVTVDMDQSFYVGDAAGRTKDHSDADIKFAQAIGLKFYVPEEYFAE
ncbi:hypothetical protein MLD38_000599 [Melastoma candidum]|uniref:Uncharacterized protein n=1 Tax=Melastoma candidum TaxID=119954 RepID=A0ACB9SAN7_9MYRT|nr:hypothetical protein MLD38_000599 [Melastoma candidum]